MPGSSRRSAPGRLGFQIAIRSLFGKNPEGQPIAGGKTKFTSLPFPAVVHDDQGMPAGTKALLGLGAGDRQLAAIDEYLKARIKQLVVDHPMHDRVGRRRPAQEPNRQARDTEQCDIDSQETPPG
jgi:hypothetical protein